MQVFSSVLLKHLYEVQDAMGRDGAAGFSSLFFHRSLSYSHLFPLVLLEVGLRHQVLVQHQVHGPLPPVPALLPQSERRLVNVVTGGGSVPPGVHRAAGSRSGNSEAGGAPGGELVGGGTVVVVVVAALGTVVVQ